MEINKQIYVRTNKENMEWKSPAHQHHHRLGMPETINIGQIVTDHLHNQSMSDSCHAEQWPASSAAES